MSDIFSAPRKPTLTSDDALARIRAADLSLPAELERDLSEAFVQRGDVIAIVARIDRAQAFRLRRRLERDRAEDPIASAFKQRLTPEHRARVLALLADPGVRARRAGTGSL